ncbi:MAG TPA: hypothetical protein VLA05_06205 [Coriobacteriia bacterium]|nr:hypothetical protein [Coriobacteriia bacterium]
MEPLPDVRWATRDRLLLGFAVLIGLLGLAGLAYLIFGLWLQLTILELFWWIVGLWISARLLWWSWGPRRQPRLRVPARPEDSAHDAAIAVSAVLGVRDGLRRD